MNRRGFLAGCLALAVAPLAWFRKRKRRRIETRDIDEVDVPERLKWVRNDGRWEEYKARLREAHETLKPYREAHRKAFQKFCKEEIPRLYGRKDQS